MNHVLDFVRAARAATDPRACLQSDAMLAELLALHDEMIVQLRFERREVVDNAEFLTGMIAQHEKTAAILRAKLENRAAKIRDEDMIVITGEATSAAAKSLVTESVQDARGPQSVRNDMTVKR